MTSRKQLYAVPFIEADPDGLREAWTCKSVAVDFTAPPYCAVDQERVFVRNTSEKALPSANRSKLESMVICASAAFHTGCVLHHNNSWQRSPGNPRLHRGSAYRHIACAAQLLASYAIFVLAVIVLVFCAVSYQARKARAVVEAEDRKVVQQAVEQYTNDNGEPPRDVEDLVKKGYLKELPGKPETS
jgi:hypothetical protein